MNYEIWAVLEESDGTKEIEDTKKMAWTMDCRSGWNWRIVGVSEPEGKDRIGNNMNLVEWWDIWNWDDKESAGIGNDMTWEWVAEVREKTQSLEKRKPRDWEAQY